MPENNSHIELRSEEVQEIMSHVPNWMIRWGITLIFCLIALLVFISWFIKYPDVIKGNVVISTTHPPTRLISKSPGQLTSLFFEDGMNVQKGDLLATVDHSFSVEARDYLELMCAEIKQQLEVDLLSIDFKDDGLNFGGIHSSYIEMKTAVLAYQNYLENDQVRFEISTISEQLRNYSTLRSVSQQQLETAKKELKNAQQKFEIDEKLYSKNVISKVQLFEEQKKLIQTENALGNTKKTIVQNSITLTDLKRDLNGLKQEHKSKQKEFLQQINIGLANIQNAVDQWSVNYQIKAPTNGKLTYFTTIRENDYIAAETPLFAIISDNQDYLGYVNVPKSGYGKVKIGQKVRIQIDKYPYQEFGQLDGKVSDISLLANEDVYRIQFTLSNGLKSSYGKTFEFTPEMSGKADIITDDVRLISRIFNKFRKVFD